MAKPNLIGGTVLLKLDGVQHATRGSWTVNHGKPTRSPVFDGNNCIGYTESPQEPSIEGEMTIFATLDLGKLVEMDGATVTLELDGGKTYALRDAWYAGEGAANVSEGSMPARFVGKSLEVVA